uniref:Uncharacterized protein LOC111108016 isoform X2 n=1 Tax=Crassostrea virginica TaxID=6565 RepID=A0A8B8B7Z6_CRAVI|nr:uncharacterized protein LOC111108016 isoform X2 [Crassostrea virginica]
MASIAKEVTDPNKCISCCQNFKVKKKGFKRTLITKLPIPLIKLNDILDKRITLPLTPTRKFLCHDCASITVKFYKHQISKGPASVSTHKTEKVYSKRKFSFTPTKHVKRKCLSSTPLKFVRSHSLKKEGFKDKVSKYIKDSHYDYAFRLLISKSKRARDALLQVLKSTVKKEVKSANIPSLQTPTTLQHLQEFNWQTVLKDSSCKLPFLSGTLQGALSCRRNRSVNIDENGCVGAHVPALGFILGNILHLHQPRRYNLLQAVISIEMYRSGCNQKIFRWFQKLGWCKGVKGTRTAVDKLCAEYDESIKSWKKSIQDELRGPQPAEDEPFPPLDSSASSDSSGSSLASISSENELSLSDGEIGFLSDEDDVEAVPLSSEDNVQDDSDDGTPLNEETLNENQTKNRICFRHLDNVDDSCSVTDIRLENFLPSSQDIRNMQTRMEAVVQKIVKANFPQFSEVHIAPMRHQYSDMSETKSEIVNLGVIRENPASTRGTLEIM